MAFSDKVESGLTVDKIIEKFFPVVWVLFFIIGLGYLLYTSVWVQFPLELKLWLGFFTSLIIVGAGFSFSERLKYFSEVIMGGWILLFYGTLIYGSRNIGHNAVIPELAALIVSSIVTVSTAYFASLRKSKVILAIALLGSYLTPFVIGWEWGTSVLWFNSYLVYFLIANVSIFLLGKEIALRDIIPLNMLGLFFGTSSLYYFGFENTSSSWYGFISDGTISAFILLLLAAFSVYTIAINAKNFATKEEWYLTVSYLVPLLWFMINISLITKVEIGDWWVTIFYAVLGVVYFWAWNYVRSLETNYQHVSLYVGWLVSLVFWAINVMPDIDYITSTIIAYTGLIFVGLFAFDSKKWERFITYLAFSLLWGFLGVFYYYTDSSLQGNLHFFLVILTLIPASLAYLFLQIIEGKNYERLSFLAIFSSVFSVIVMFLSTLWDLMKLLELPFVLGILPSLFFVSFWAFSKDYPLQKRIWFLEMGMVLLAFGFMGKFFFLITTLIPEMAIHISFSTSLGLIVNSLFALVIMYIALGLSRRIQAEKKEKRPSFLLVIFWYSTLLLLVNAILFMTINYFGASTDGLGWPRAIVTTLWWMLLAGVMMAIWLKGWPVYKSEKLLGLLLATVTVGKIVFYDMATMDTQKKIIVLMIVWGFMMMLSYFFHTQDWFKNLTSTSDWGGDKIKKV